MSRRGARVLESCSLQRGGWAESAPGLGLAVFLVGSVAAGHASAPVQLPDWMTQASTRRETTAPLPESWKDARALYLLEDTLITVDSDGQAVERYRAVVKILRQQGREYARPGGSSSPTTRS